MPESGNRWSHLRDDIWHRRRLTDAKFIDHIDIKTPDQRRFVNVRLAIIFRRKNHHRLRARHDFDDVLRHPREPRPASPQQIDRRYQRDHQPSFRTGWSGHWAGGTWVGGEGDAR